jgi:hypothetical protein
MRAQTTALMILALAGCVPSFLGGGDKGSTDDGLSRQILLAGSGITAVAPSGYCIDFNASGVSEPAAFVAFRRCEVLRGEDFALSRRALLTASISEDSASAPVVAGSEQRLLDFFATDAGKKALSRSADPSTVTVLQSYAKDGAVWLQVRDTSPAQQLDASYWRALFDLKGRIVTVTVAAYVDGPMPANRAKSLVQDFVARLSAANSAEAVTRAAGSVVEPLGKGLMPGSPRN